jgi:3-dehydroquinate synthase
VKKVELITSESNSKIVFGFDWKRVSEMIPDENVIIITDDNVKALYNDGFPRFPVLSITPGEASKSLSTIEFLVEQMLTLGIDRNGFVLAIGGGVVCDIAGFVASVYMRGIRFGFVSTSLLSQVDASIGGKNGVNCMLSKNVIGVFNQPEFVICDETMLETLPETEYVSGLAELVKSAFIKDPGMIGEIEEGTRSILLRDKAVLREFIFRAVKIKSTIVESDLRESGLRKLLNFGHTFGHAAELEYGIPHGIAVAWGMHSAIHYSYHRGYLKTTETERLNELIDNLGLLKGVSIDGKRISGHLTNDKKREGEEINFVFLSSPGNAFVEKVGISELKTFIESR